MLESLFKEEAAVRRMRSNLLGSHIETYAALSIDLGYHRSTIRVQLWLLAKLGIWLERKGFTVTDLSEDVTDRFLAQVSSREHRRCGNERTLFRFLEHLRDKCLIPIRKHKVDKSPLGRIKSRYEIYLAKERGIAAETGTRYWPYICRFLVDCFGDGPIQPRALCPRDISRFLIRHAQSRTPKVAQLMVTALRSFFRFLFQHGETENDLSKAVLTVPSWRLAEVPKYLKPEEVECLLHACDLTTPIGRRNYAVLLLLARLGLRAGEVVTMELDDIDWRAGELTVRGKGKFRDRLPLPKDAGEALATYLCQDRPSCSTRRVFVRMRAPHQGFHHPSSVSTIVCRTLDKAGLNPPIKGAHLLRHSLATGMLHRGSSMAEIGEVLRHWSPHSTEIYTKVDIEGLRSIARPWPGKGEGR